MKHKKEDEKRRIQEEETLWSWTSEKMYTSRKQQPKQIKNDAKKKEANEKMQCGKTEKWIQFATKKQTSEFDTDIKKV